MVNNEDIKDIDEPLTDEEAAKIAGGLASIRPPKLGGISTSNISPVARTEVTTEEDGTVDQ